MPVLKIDILSKPEEKTDAIERTIFMAARATNVQIKLSTTHNFVAFPQVASNFSQTPIVIFNGHVEFTGKSIDLEAVKRKLSQIASQGDGF